MKEQKQNRCLGQEARPQPVTSGKTSFHPLAGAFAGYLQGPFHKDRFFVK